MSYKNILLSVTATFLFAWADITTPPEPTTALLNTNATFTCVTNESQAFWRVDGVSAVRTSVKERGITFVTLGAVSRLLILASEQNNNSVVVCGAYCGGGQIISAPVKLKVQGLLAPPKNFSVISNNTALHLNWAPPFTYDISGIDPDITGYNVYAMRIDARDQSAQTTVVSVPEGYYMIKIQPCPIHYEFRVSAINGAGEGNTTAPLLVPCQQAVLTVTSFSLGATSYGTLSSTPVSFAPAVNSSDHKKGTIIVVIAATGATVSSCSIIAFLSATVLIKCYYTKHQTKEPEINMNENFAYEKPPVMSASGINMEENSAYGAFEIL